MAEDKVPLLERPGKGNDDDDEDFGPLEQTVKDHQDYGWDWDFKQTNGHSKLQEYLKELEKEREKEQEEFEMTPKTSTGRETLRPKKWELKTPQLKNIITDAMKTVEENFPNLNRSKLEEFSVNVNEFGVITIKGSRINAVPHNLFDDDGDMNESIPKTIKDILGEQISDKGLREQLVVAKGKKEQYKKNMKKMKESIKEKDDEIKTKDDEIKEKEKDAIMKKKMEELIKEKDDIIKKKMMN